MEISSDPAWYHDVRALVRRPAEFWPAMHQTPEERLNSVSRLALYVGAALAAYRRHPKYLAFAAGIVAVLGLLASLAATSRRRRRGRGGVDDARSRWQRPVAAIAGVRVPHARPAARLCTRSSPQNPFANWLLTDGPNRPPACPYDEHKEDIRTNFNRGLVRNAYDIYEKENSQRQFHTMPHTTSTPDTVAFAQFCYGSSGRPTCKEQPSRCTGSLP